MSCINDVRLVGKLAEDVVISRSGNSEAIHAKVETFRPIKDKATNQTKWLTQLHSVSCYRKEMVPVMQKHGKKGRFVKLFGELTYTNDGKARIVVGAFGEFSMMNSVGQSTTMSQNSGENRGAQQTEQQNNSQQQSNNVSDSKSFAVEDDDMSDGGDGFNSASSFTPSDDDIPF